MQLLIQVVLQGLVVIALAVLWVPALSELCCLLRRRPLAPRRVMPVVPERLLFLVPAHNEELHIGDCVRSLVALDYPVEARRIIVVADNCIDSTAAIASEAGAECLVRADPAQRGKPRALAWAIPQLDIAAWDAVVIVDADTVVEPDFGWGLCQRGPLREVAVQGTVLANNEWDNWLTRLGGMLARCRYEVTYPIKNAGGLNIPLTGNGMAIGSGVLIRLGWNAYSIAEDSELYAQYTIEGIPILHAPLATVLSAEPVRLGEGATQRRRWLAGRLEILRANWRALLASPNVGWHQRLDLVGELLLSNPVVHLILGGLLAMVALLLFPTPYGWVVAILSLGSLSAIAITTASVLRHHPQRRETMRAFLWLPFYVFWRAALFLWTLVTLSDRRWHRSPRQRRRPAP